MKTLIQFWNNLFSPTPEFEIKVRNFCGSIAVISGIIVALPLSGVAIPSSVITAATIIGSIAVGITGKAQATKKPETK
jgi:hypothetical protein